MNGGKGNCKVSTIFTKDNQVAKSKIQRKYSNLKTVLLLFLSVSILFTSCTIFNKNKTSTEINKQELPALIPYRVGNKWGYCDKNKKVIIPSDYDEVGFFSEGLAPVRLNGKWGYINSNGTLVAPQIYREAYSFNENLALVCDTNGSYSFVDKDGNRVIPLQNSSYVLTPPIEGRATSFLDSEGLWPVRINNKNNGYVNNKGELVIELPELYEFVDFFREGYARIRTNNKFGFIDKTGKLAIPLVYESALPFSEGLAAVELNNKWGFIDKTGTLVIPAIYDDVPPIVGVSYFFKENLCPVSFNWKYGFIDNKGNFTISPQYDWADSFYEGLALVELDEKYGFINTNGDVVIPIIYDGASYFSDELGRVNINGKWGFIDRTGKVAIPLTYRATFDFKCGLALVYVGSEPAGYIDKNGIQYWED